ncbi:MAG: hypothetical protein DI586_00170 [Micavibrio aeruginosavorus]|uniref:Methyltransferase FkbM domain-containing protein n=1 Tax=Micavibrio aeruginosavorus TaxID=349221 RepID=A0A2W5FNF0_9BACT|nr:MAG: hypothetical protein DI586_00170 [Micavibrio aeruginosavorus]
MADKDYNILREVNGYYFDSNPDLTLIMPKYYEEATEEGEAITKISQMIEQNRYDEALAFAENCLIKFPPEAQNAFLSWQICIYWRQKKIPNSELIEYFSSLVEAYPDSAYLNFDKAFLHVKNRDFNEAVKELKIARKKEPNHAPSMSLLFLIYYLAGDEQWKSLYLSATKSKLLPERILNLISIGEAIKDRKPSPLYLSGDLAKHPQLNEELLEKFPKLIMVKSPSQKNILMAAAETNYLREFIPTLILSALEIKDRDFGIHVHLYAPMGVDLELLQMYDEKFPELNLSYSYEKISYQVVSGMPTYYSTMRFCRAWQILKESSLSERLALVDADAILRKDPFKNDKIKNADILLTYNPAAPLWDKFAGGFVSFSKSDSALDALSYMSNIILKNIASRKEFWFIDQVALFDMNSNYSKKVTIDTISGDELFGKDLQHKEGSIFWTFTNDEKVMNNPMNSERVRLMSTYGLTQEWNILVKGKYGTVVANRNDEYIGRSLISGGSWCDHEIGFMKSLLDFGDTVVELGSNIGSHTLPIAKIIGASGRLYAMEPQRILFQSLCANIANNSLTNVYTLNQACGEKEGILKVQELDPTKFQNFGGFQPKARQGEHEVAVRPLDSLKLKECKLIKMDIEGMELEALKGATEILTHLKPMIYFEAHGDSVMEIASYLKDFGYKIYDFATPNDPMYLAVTEKDQSRAKALEIKELHER